ncbi:MAG: Co2+/Mg2+ efflux protein ApaG [Bacteroidota bacterium]
MVSQITKGIKISVETTFREEFSSLKNSQFVFSYRISMENTSDYPVQLLRRHWFIFDSVGEYSEVEGEGVVGEKPELLPGDVYEYESSCSLLSEMGTMYGTYLFERKVDGAQFKVDIPEFELVAPYRLN